jgi:hypothetical protein
MRIVDETPAGTPVEGVNVNGEAASGLLGRLRQRGDELAHGRRLVIQLPGWEDVDGERGLWARFTPLTRSMQQQWGMSFDDAKQEVELIAPMLAECCEEILIGTAAERTPLAREIPDRNDILPLRFDADLGQLLGIGGQDGATVIKRLLIRAGDDLPFFAVFGELFAWSGQTQALSVEVAAGE